MKKLAVLVGVALVFAAFTMVAVAADVSGTYVQKIESPKGTSERTFILKQDGTKLTGKIVVKRGEQTFEQEIKDGTVNGNDVEFKVDQRMGENTVTATYKAKVTDDKIEGTQQVGEKPARPFSATKQK